MRSPTPKQDGHTISDIVAMHGMKHNNLATRYPKEFSHDGNLWLEAILKVDEEAEKAIEAYCENERRKAVEEYIASQKEGDGTSKGIRHISQKCRTCAKEQNRRYNAMRKTRGATL